MKQYPIALYNFCSDPIKNALKMFCNRLNQSNADVFIIMAHKAVLLFEVLLEQGYIDKRVGEKIVVTNLALDFDYQYLIGKRIAILDDIVISGTSLASTVNRLLSIGILQDDIEIIAVAVDQYYFAMNFNNAMGAKALHCDCQMDDASCIELSAIISKAFSYYGIPYDADFPVYEEISVRPEHLNSLHNNLFWNVVDVSNGNHKAGGVTVYTLCPTKLVRCRLWDSIEADMDNCADVKIRLYVTKYPDGALNCCVVPMFLFKEISVDVLEILYDHLKPVDQQLSDKISCVAQMRYIEFIIAHHLYQVFSEISTIGQGTILHERNVMQLFGLNDGAIIYQQLCASASGDRKNSILRISNMEVNYSSILEEYKRSSIYDKSCKDSKNWMTDDAYQIGCWINHFIFTPFLWWYNEKEIHIRHQLKAKALHYVKDYPQIEACLYRLKSGFSVGMLQQFLLDRVPDFSGYEAENVISLFLDRAIDEGIIVPTIYYNSTEKYICRAYRHGEDLPFGAADQFRLVYFMQSIGKYISESSEGEDGSLYPAVSEISLEKMIVLFYQMGLRQGNIFNRFLGFDNIDIIHSFLSVHGVIQGYTNPKADYHIYSERNSRGMRYITWLTTWLYENGLIESRPDNTDDDESSHFIPINLDKIAEYIKENECSSASNTVRKSIESLAELITQWYNSDKKNFKDDITALTSCSNCFIYASAIATENHYFYKYWNNQVQHALQEKRDSCRLVKRLTDSDDNKRYTSTIIQGLYSGQKKIKWRRNRTAQKIIDGVNRFLSPTGSKVWSQLWSGADTDPDHGTVDLIPYTQMAEGFLYFFSACFDCLRSTDFWDSGEMSQNFEENKEEYLKLAQSTNLLDGSLFTELKTIANIGSNDMGKKVEKFKELVCEAMYSSEECVREIEACIRDMDPTYTITYKSALIIDIDALDFTQVEAALMCLWNQIPEDETKTELNLIRFPQELNTPSFVKYGVFFAENTPQPLDFQPGQSGNNAEKYGAYLYDFFNKICSILNGRIFQIRAILLPHITPGPTTLFKHNLRQNIEQNATDFYKTVVQPLESCYEAQWKMQLILGLDRYVGKNFCNLFHKWTSHELDCPIPRAEWVTKCIICFKDYVRSNTDSSSLMERIAYSQLKVRCGEWNGLGLLVRLPNQVVCISCEHIFVDYFTRMQAQAKSAFWTDMTFDINPLTRIYQLPENDYIRPAANEVIVLEPCWEGNIPFDISKLISLEDFTDAFSHMKCKCCGCNGDEQLKWVSSIFVEGPIEGGYYQIAGKTKSIGHGFSGGVYVGEESQNACQIIGIHEGRFDEEEQVRMIPSASIKTALEKVIERGFTNG